MKTILSEKNLVVLLFVLVLVTFSLAHEDTKKMEYLNYGSSAPASTAEMNKPSLKDVTTNTMTVIPAGK